MLGIDINAGLEAVYRKHVPGFTKLKSVERLSGGASQETYRIELESSEGKTTHALRRSAGGEIAEVTAEHPGLNAEAKLMQAAEVVGVPVPEIIYVLAEADGLGAGFIMQWLEGETLGSRIVRSEKFEALRPKLAENCGRLLAKIHSIKIDEADLTKELSQISPREFVEQTWQRYRELNTSQAMIDYTARWLLENLPENHDVCLVHNDFRNGNLMVSDTEVVAVLDWELAHIGDPMRDLGWICVNSWRFGSELPVGGFGEYEDFFDAYETESGKVVDRSAVKFWEVFGSFWWSIGCLGMAEHYRNGPDKSVERPAVGRRSSECQIDCVNLLIPGAVRRMADTSYSSEQMPSNVELIDSVVSFIRDELIPSGKGRTQFLSRVSANSLDIVKRELQYASSKDQNELNRLQDYFQSQDDLHILRSRLIEFIRTDKNCLSDEILHAHLRQSVFDQINIDQPKYSGLAKCLSQSE